jgi:hypothetical protein
MELVGDERAQSIQIGAVLLFAVLLIAVSSYQAFIIPNQNRQVEFNHNQQVQRDMVEVRNTLLDTYSGGDDGYTEVTLGTTFPPRLLALNPPSATGSLSTTDPRPITIEDRNGTDITTDVCPGDNVESQSLEYTPSYSTYRGAGTLRYESSFLLHAFGSESVQLTDQTLIQGDRLQILPLTGDISVGGTQTVAVEPRAGVVDTSTRAVGNVTLPTQTSESRWRQLLDGQVDPSNVTVTNGAAGSNVTITLNEQLTVECGPVGLGQSPTAVSGDGGGDGGADAINPAAPGNIRLVSEVRNNKNMTLTFNNSAGVNNITDSRINFYKKQGGGATPSSASIRRVGEPASGTLDIGGPYESLSPKIRLDGKDTETAVRLTFDTNINQNDWFILSVQLETGETGLYFVAGS